MSARDTQRQRVYYSEHQVMDLFRILSHRQSQIFVNQVTTSFSWCSVVPYTRSVPVMLRPRYAKSSMANVVVGSIEMEIGMLDHLTLLHELAHLALYWNQPRSSRFADHGPEFVYILRILAKEHLTRKQFLAWESSALLHGVRWSKSNLRFA